jgi:hypothetical protein
MKVRKFKIAVVIAISLGVVVCSAIDYAQSITPLAVCSIPHSQLFEGAATVTVRTRTINHGNSLAWHYHPGHAFNVVKSGRA